MATDVVVIANNGGFGAGDVFYSQYNIGADPQERPSVYNSNDGANAITARVTVHVDNAAHQDEAVVAAQKVAKAIATIIAAAEHLPANTGITLADGKQITAGKLIDYLGETKFVVTDHSYNSTTGGVGASDYSGLYGPPHTDYLDYSSFGYSGYGAATYGDTGMVGIMLHEVSHMTAEGFANSSVESSTWHREDPGAVAHGESYLDTQYFKDNEAYADTSAHSMANAMSLNVDGYYSHYTYDGLYMGAAQIYADHVG